MQIKAVNTLEDYKVIAEMEALYYDLEHVSDYKDSYVWYQFAPESNVTLSDGEKIIGFADIMIIRQAVFEEMLLGEYNDKYMELEHLYRKEDLAPGDVVNLLFSCVVVHHEYRQTEALKFLLRPKSPKNYNVLGALTPSTL